jgi:hypothetical protein
MIEPKKSTDRRLARRRISIRASNGHNRLHNPTQTPRLSNQSNTAACPHTQDTRVVDRTTVHESIDATSVLPLSISRSAAFRFARPRIVYLNG